MNKATTKKFDLLNHIREAIQVNKRKLLRFSLRTRVALVIVFLQVAGIAIFGS